MDYNVENIFESFGGEDLTFSMLRQAKLAKGRYEYFIEEVYKEDKVPTAFGVKDRIVIKYSIDFNGEKVEIIEKMNISKSPKSRLMKFIKSICEIYNTQSVNLKDLEGSRGYLELEHVTDDIGNVYERVVKIEPIAEIIL